MPLTKTTGQYLNGGFNLVANPYPCPVNFGAVSFGVGVNKAYFIWDGNAGNYAVYVAAAGSAERVGINLPGGAEANSGQATIPVLDAVGRQVAAQDLALSGNPNTAYKLQATLAPGSYTLRCKIAAGAY